MVLFYWFAYLIVGWLVLGMVADALERPFEYLRAGSDNSDRGSLPMLYYMVMLLVWPFSVCFLLGILATARHLMKREGDHERTDVH